MTRNSRFFVGACTLYFSRAFRRIRHSRPHARRGCPSWRRRGARAARPPRGAVLARRPRPRRLSRVTSCTCCAAWTLPRHPRTFRIWATRNRCRPLRRDRARSLGRSVRRATRPSSCGRRSTSPRPRPRSWWRRRSWTSFASGSRAGTRRGGIRNRRAFCSSWARRGAARARRYGSRRASSAGTCTSGARPCRPCGRSTGTRTEARTDGRQTRPPRQRTRPSSTISRRSCRERRDTRRSRASPAPARRRRRRRRARSTEPATKRDRKRHALVNNTTRTNANSPFCWWRTCPSAAARTSTAARSTCWRAWRARRASLRRWPSPRRTPAASAAWVRTPPGAGAGAGAGAPRMFGPQIEEPSGLPSPRGVSSRRWKPPAPKWSPSTRRRRRSSSKRSPPWRRRSAWTWTTPVWPP